MIAAADVFVQNLAPGAAQRAGFGSEELRARHPGLRLTVETALPRDLLERRFIPPPFDHVARPADVGMVMRDALAVDVAASCAAYRDAHRERGRRLGEAVTALVRMLRMPMIGRVDLKV